MKKQLIIFTAIALTLISCNKEVKPQGKIEKEKESVTLNIGLKNIKSFNTRSIGKDWQDANIKSLTVYIFNEDNSLDAYKTVSNSTSIQLDCSPGNNKSICAFTNLTNSNSINSLNDIKNLTTKLSDNEVGQFIMSGQLKRNINTNQSISIEVKRSAAKISIDRIENKIPNNFLNGRDFKITGIYLINVATGNYPLFNSSYTPEDWGNKSKFISDNNLDSFCYDQLNQVIGTNASYESTHTFYCYPNPTSNDANNGIWTPRKTRLVIEASLGGRKCYYPLTLDSVKPNTHYHFTNLVITKRGSDNPDTPVSTEQITFNINVSEWTESNMGEITI